MVLLKAYIFKSEKNLKTFYSYNMERNQDKDSGEGPDSRRSRFKKGKLLFINLLYYKFFVVI